MSFYMIINYFPLLNWIQLHGVYNVTVKQSEQIHSDYNPELKFVISINNSMWWLVHSATKIYTENKKKKLFFVFNFNLSSKAILNKII